MYDAVAVGEVLIDFVITGRNPSGYPILSSYPGGAPANYLSVLAKFGLQTSMISKVGDDAFGRMLTQTLLELKINKENVICDSSFFTTMAFVTLDDNGNREFSFLRKPGADTCLGINEINLSVIDQCRSIYYGTTSLTDDPARSTVKEIVTYAKSKNKITVFDPNLRRSLWRDLNKAKAEMQWGMQNADIVKISEEEVLFLFEMDLMHAAERMVREYGVKIVFVTLGEKGCFYMMPQFSGTVGGISDIKVMDTTGAGDIFAGSVMYQILTSDSLFSELRHEELNEMVRFACVSAGLSTTRAGGIHSVFKLPEIMAVVENRYQFIQKKEGKK